MNLKCSLRIAAIVLAFGLGTAVGQQPAPAENKGLKTSATTIVDLGPEIAGMDGRQLRLRVLTLDPSGVIGIHSHRDRPAVAHLLQGTLTLHRESGPTRDITPGTSWSENKDTVHWGENRGASAVVFIAADIVKP
jgi:quercetin dioxygenase-like cupin family protein